MGREPTIRPLLVLALVLPATALVKEPILHVLSETEVKKTLIAESINAYLGTCLCPHSSARKGSPAGGVAHGVSVGDTDLFVTKTK